MFVRVPAPPDPVFGGFTATPSFADAGFGVFVAAAVLVAAGVDGTMVDVAVGVALGVCVLSLPGVSVGTGVGVQGGRWNAAWISPSGCGVAVAVASHGTMLPALAVPDVMYANPNISTPAAMAAVPIVTNLFDLTTAPP